MEILYIEKNNLKTSCRDALLDFNKKSVKEKLLQAENLLIYKVATDHLLKEYEKRVKYLEDKISLKNKTIDTYLRIVNKSLGHK